MIIETLASGSSGNVHILDDGNGRVLLDCGIPYRKLKVALKFSLRGILGCLVTHEHGDHIAAACGLMDAGISCYVTEGSRLAGRLGANPFLRTIDYLQAFRLGAWTIEAIPTQHGDAMEPCGFVLSKREDKVLYWTDSGTPPPLSLSPTYLIVECNHSEAIVDRVVARGTVAVELGERVKRTHLSIEKLMAWLDQVDTSRLIYVKLIHLSGNNSDESFLLKIQKKIPHAMVVLA